VSATGVVPVDTESVSVLLMSSQDISPKIDFMLYAVDWFSGKEVNENKSTTFVMPFQKKKKNC
jgi:hypothetical protein